MIAEPHTDLCNDQDFILFGLLDDPTYREMKTRRTKCNLFYAHIVN